MTEKQFGVNCMWENGQGRHMAFAQFQPRIDSRPGKVGLSVAESIERDGQKTLEQMACAVLDLEQLQFLYVQLGELLGRRTALYPIQLVEQACDLVDRATNLAARRSDRRVGPEEDELWGEIGSGLERVRKQIT